MANKSVVQKEPIMSKSEIEELEAELAGEKSSVQKRLTPDEWKKITLLWEYGNHTLAELSERFGIRPDSIHKKLSNAGTVKGSRAHEAAATATSALEDEMAKQAAENTKRIITTRNDHYRFAEAITKMVMQELINANNTKAAFSTKDANLSALNKAAKTLEVLRKERYALLGLDKEDGDPDDMDELIITELSPEQIESMQAQMRNIEFEDPLADLIDTNDLVEEEGED